MFSLKLIVMTAALAVSAAALPPHADYVTTITQTFDGITTTLTETVDAPYTTTEVLTVSGTPTTVTTVIEPFPTR